MDKNEACTVLSEHKEKRLAVAEQWARLYAGCSDIQRYKMYEEGAHLSLCLVILWESFTAPLLKEHKDILRRMFHMLDDAEMSQGVDPNITRPAKDCIFSLMTATSKWDKSQIETAQHYTLDLIDKHTSRLSELTKSLPHM